MIKFYTTCLALALTGSAFAQQLPNSGFENWSTATENPSAMDPDGFFTSNFCTGPPFNACVDNVERTTDKHSGTYAAKLTVKTILTEPVNGGITTDLNINPEPIPFAFKPTSVSAYVKFAPQGGDVARIRVILFNGTTEVGTATILIDAAKSVYTKVEEVITYTNTLAPDGILVDLVSGDDDGNDPVDGTILFIDDLTFGYGTTATYSSVSPVKIITNTDAGILTFSETVEAVSIVNMNGTTVQSSGAADAVALQGIQAGLYVVRFSYKGQLYAHKIVMQ